MGFACLRQLLAPSGPDGAALAVASAGDGAPQWPLSAARATHRLMKVTTTLFKDNAVRALGDAQLQRARGAACRGAG